MLNVTFLGEILTFAVLVWVTMKYVWPPIMQAIADRQKQIADGLAASERGQQALVEAREQAVSILQQAKSESQDMLNQANRQADKILERNLNQAKQEGAHLIQLAKESIESEKHAAYQELQQHTATLAVTLLEKFLHKTHGEAKDTETTKEQDPLSTNAKNMRISIDQKLVEQLMQEL